MRESEVMGNYHASFGERDGETRPMRVGKVRAVPTLLSPLAANIYLHQFDQYMESTYLHFTSIQRVRRRNSPFASSGPSCLNFKLPVESRPQDRKSTRLNSSHVAISYAVFCLKKKR